MQSLFTLVVIIAFGAAYVEAAACPGNLVKVPCLTDHKSGWNEWRRFKNKCLDSKCAWRGTSNYGGRSGGTSNDWTGRCGTCKYNGFYLNEKGKVWTSVATEANQLYTVSFYVHGHRSVKGKLTVCLHSACKYISGYPLKKSTFYSIALQAGPGTASTFQFKNVMATTITGTCVVLANPTGATAPPVTPPKICPTPAPPPTPTPPRTPQPPPPTPEPTTLEPTEEPTEVPTPDPTEEPTPRPVPEFTPMPGTSEPSGGVTPIPGGGDTPIPGGGDTPIPGTFIPSGTATPIPSGSSTPIPGGGSGTPIPTTPIPDGASTPIPGGSGTPIPGGSGSPVPFSETPTPGTPLPPPTPAPTDPTSEPTTATPQPFTPYPAGHAPQPCAPTTWITVLNGTEDAVRVGAVRVRVTISHARFIAPENIRLTLEEVTDGHSPNARGVKAFGGRMLLEATMLQHTEQEVVFRLGAAPNYFISVAEPWRISARSLEPSTEDLLPYALVACDSDPRSEALLVGYATIDTSENSLNNAAKQASNAGVGVAATAAMAAPAAAGDIQALAMLGMMSCASPLQRSRNRVLELVLAPLRIGANTAFGMVVGNAVLVAAFVCLHAAFLIPFGRDLKGQARAKFPSISLKVLFLLSPGMMFGAAYVAMRTTDFAIYAVAVSWVAVVALVVAVQRLYAFVKHKLSVDFFTYDSTANRAKWAQIFLPMGCWGPRDANRRFGALFVALRADRMMFAVLGVAVELAFAVITAIPVSGSFACRIQGGVLAALFAIYAVFLAAYRPYRSPALNALSVVSNVCLTIIIGSNVAASDHPEGSAPYVAGVVTLVFVVTNALRTLLGVFIFILERVWWRKVDRTLSWSLDAARRKGAQPATPVDEGTGQRLLVEDASMLLAMAYRQHGEDEEEEMGTVVPPTAAAYVPPTASPAPSQSSLLTIPIPAVAKAAVVPAAAPPIALPPPSAHPLTGPDSDEEATPPTRRVSAATRRKNLALRPATADAPPPSPPWYAADTDGQAVPRAKARPVLVRGAAPAVAATEPAPTESVPTPPQPKAPPSTVSKASRRRPNDFYDE